MRKVTIKGLLAHKLRLALTSLAIVLGVTFVAGTFVLTDTLRNTVYALIGNAYQKLDFEVRGVAQFPATNAPEAVRNPFPETLLSTVRSVPGVQTAEGVVGGYAQFLASDGKPIVTGSEPTVGESFDPDRQRGVTTAHRPLQFGRRLSPARCRWPWCAWSTCEGRPRSASHFRHNLEGPGRRPCARGLRRVQVPGRVARPSG